MMRSLWRVVLAVAAMMVVGAALALGFDESGVDFANEGLTTAHVALDRTAEGLTVFLADAKVSGTVGTMDVEDMINDFDDDDFTSTKIYQRLGARPWSPTVFSEALQVANASSWYRWIRVRHDESAEKVTPAYLARLTELGYAIQEEPISSTITAYTLTLGEENVRMVIARRGPDTLVTLSRM